MSTNPTLEPVIVNVPAAGVEFEVRVTVATPLAFVVAEYTAGGPGNQARLESLRVKVTN
jgi:hypothetical protein